MRENYNLLVNADIDEVFAVNNKEITPPVNYSDIAVKGDNMSNSLIFKMNSVLDGVDISDKTFEIYYINADGYSDIAAANEVTSADGFVLFSWLLDSNVTRAAGEVKYIIKVTGDNYVWKSKPSSFKVADTLGEEINLPEYNPVWSENIEKKIATLENEISEIVNWTGWDS